MFEKPNIKTLNHKFKIAHDTEGHIEDYTSEPATKKEIDDAIKDLKKNKHEFMPIGRSCWECNGAHIHLIDMPAMNCFSCGRIYHNGIDITNYAGSKYEKHTHLKTKKQEKDK